MLFLRGEGVDEASVRERIRMRERKRETEGGDGEANAFGKAVAT